MGSKTRFDGDRYQHLYSWYELLQLLDDGSPYEYCIIEHPHAGSADDVTLHPQASSGVPAKFMQIKWHVDHRDAYSFDSLTAPVKGARSLLGRLFDSWQKLHPQGPLEVWLVSNWCATPELGQYIEAWDYKLSEEFISSDPSTPVGRLREKWRLALGATDEEARAFCRVLRLRLGFASISTLEENVDDRMARFGLRSGENARAAGIDEVTRSWIVRKGNPKKITREVILKSIDRRRLRPIKPDAPQVSLWLHGWGKKHYDTVAPVHELDWTPYFEREPRRIADRETWDNVLFPALDQVRDQLTSMPEGSGDFIDFRGKIPLTVALAVGWKFPEVGSFRFRVEQPPDRELWTSDAPASGLKFGLIKKLQKGEGTRKDLLIALCIIGSAWDEVNRIYEENDLIGAMVYVEKIKRITNADAVALADQAKTLIRDCRREYKTSRTHLILFAPAAFCLFLGQKLNAVGNILTYEEAGEGGYQFSVELRT